MDIILFVGLSAAAYLACDYYLNPVMLTLRKNNSHGDCKITLLNCGRTVRIYRVLLSSVSGRQTYDITNFSILNVMKKESPDLIELICEEDAAVGCIMCIHEEQTLFYAKKAVLDYVSRFEEPKIRKAVDKFCNDYVLEIRHTYGTAILPLNGDNSFGAPSYTPLKPLHNAKMFFDQYFVHKS